MAMRHYVYLVRPPRPTFMQDAREDESAAVGAHFRYLQEMLADGKLIIAGPCEDAAFGVVVFRAENDASAAMFVREDPAVAAGVFSAELHPFRLSLIQG